MSSRITVTYKPAIRASKEFYRRFAAAENEIVRQGAARITDGLIGDTDTARANAIEARLRQPVSATQSRWKWAGTLGAAIFASHARRRGLSALAKVAGNASAFYAEIERWWQRKKESIGYRRRGWVPARELFGGRRKTPPNPDYARGYPGSARIQRKIVGSRRPAMAEAENVSDDLAADQPGIVGKNLQRNQRRLKRDISTAFKRAGRRSGFETTLR
jgi:hypothetical protein